jgi:hypothetical protein
MWDPPFPSFRTLVKTVRLGKVIRLAMIVLVDGSKVLICFDTLICAFYFGYYGHGLPPHASAQPRWAWTPVSMI